ncbi:hypothetical protein AVEN_50537-1 [Araneus ventricosus]|uniref:Uncharacterized protein n=1 Tax=Araneus ventricosus TaxID=182803 RepID=A0A4Y2APU8_ARAVE|nr:hypothetical protein AVEN_50537-1 [Araneus ventricosus]
MNISAQRLTVRELPMRTRLQRDPKGVLTSKTIERDLLPPNSCSFKGKFQKKLHNFALNRDSEKILVLSGSYILSPKPRNFSPSLQNIRQDLVSMASIFPMHPIESL